MNVYSSESSYCTYTHVHTNTDKPTHSHTHTQTTFRHRNFAFSTFVHECLRVSSVRVHATERVCVYVCYVTAPALCYSSLESRAGFKGLCKKMAVLLVVWMAVMLDGVTGSTFIRTAVCLFFIANEGLSILENFAVMGVPFPKFLKDMLEIMQETADKGTEPSTHK